jgi:hypothetical protein
MNDPHRGSPSRCLLTWLVASAAAGGAAAWALPDLAPPPAVGQGSGPTPSFDAWLPSLCAGVTALCAGWGWLVTTVVVLEALGRRPRAASAGVPAWARRVLLGACGVAVLGSAAPAPAAPAPGDGEGREWPAVLDGLPLPDRAEGRDVSSLPEPHRRHRVRPGDSLWSVAEATLRATGAPAAAADVAAYWPRIYALNRDLVGADPNLIRPGQLLRLADPTTTPTAGEDLR